MRLVVRTWPLIALAGCAHAIPTATTTDPELCFRETRPRLVAPHGDQVGVCYGDGDCLVVDHVHGTMVKRVGWPHAEQGFPPELREPQRVDKFELERSDTDEATFCAAGDRATCHAMHLPGVTDARTVLPAISLDGASLYYVVREGAHAFLDTVATATSARTGRVPLAGADAPNHLYSVDRIGTAILVRDSIPRGLNDEPFTYTLIDPATTARRELLDGGAIELDDHTAIVVDANGASIVETHGLVTLERHVAAGGAAVGVNRDVGVLAFGSPSSIVVIEHRHVTREWRMPMCH